MGAIMADGEDGKGSQAARSGNGKKDDSRNDQIERILIWCGIAMATGLLILAVHAVTLDPWFDGWRFFSIGAFAALVSGAAGGSLGLLFGLPISRARAARDNPGGEEAKRTDWFSDNASMEEIADWLTKIIVGLTLTQWEAIQNQFNRLAAAVTAAMIEPSAAAPRVVVQAVARTMRGDAGMVPGGTIIGAYFILGFIAVYLWARGYLAEALARGLRTTRKVQKESDDDFIKKVEEHGAVQTGEKTKEAAADATKAASAAQAAVGEPKAEPAPDAAEAKAGTRTGRSRRQMRKVQKEADQEFIREAEEEGAVQPAWNQPTPEEAESKAAGAVEGAAPPAPRIPFDQIVRPGRFREDPWRGQFGGRSSDDRTEVTAEVRPLEQDPNYFAVKVKIRSRNILQRFLLRGFRARIYLHPSFEDSIREEQFDREGKIDLPLLAYGAFTLGVQLEDGRLLELNLAELPDAPPLFKVR